jgi:hypothetical protein
MPHGGLPLHKVLGVCLPYTAVETKNVMRVVPSYYSIYQMLTLLVSRISW